MPISDYQIRKKDLFLISIIFALALFFRLAYFTDYKNTAAFPVLPESDGDFYYQRASDIASGDLFNSKAFLKWPLYAYLLAFLFKISANNVPLIYALQFLLGASTCVLLYFIARELFNETIGFIAALLCAWYGLFIFYEGLLIYTALSLFLNAILFLVFLQINDNPDTKGLFWMGIFLGICTITQGSIIFFGIPAILWIIWKNGQGFKKSISYFLCFGLGLALVLGALVLRSYVVDRDPVLLTGNTGLNFYIGNSVEADGTIVWPRYLSPTAEGMLRDAKVIAKINLGKELKPSEVSRFWLKKATEFIKKNPDAYLKLLAKKINYLFSPKELVYEPEYYFIPDKIRVFKIMFMDLRFILPFALLGMLLNLKNFKKIFMLYLAFLAVAFSMILFFVQAKFRVMLVPYLMIFSASGFFAFVEAIRKKRFLQFGLLFLGFSLFFILLNSIQTDKYLIKNTRGNLDEFRYHFAKAIAYEKTSDYQAALRELNFANKIRPNNHNIIYSFGVIYYYLNRLDEAEGKFKEAMAISPFFVDAYYNLGFLYNRRKRFDKAIEVLEKAAFLDPDDIAVTFELARAYQAKGMIKETKEQLRLILKKTRYRPAQRAVIEKELANLEK
jgi:tetratricopeptide (TPR) repeat protein